MVEDSFTHGLTVAGRATLLRLDIPVLFQVEAQILLSLKGIPGIWMLHRIGSQPLLRVIIQVENLFQRAEMLLGVSVTVETPAHRVRFSLVDHLHLINLAMTGLAGDSPIDVSRMVEKHVVRILVHPHPLDRLPVKILVVLIKRPPQGLQFLTILGHMLVAIPAGAGGWDIGMPRMLHKAVTVATIHPELVHVQGVIIRNGLRRHIPNTLSLRSRVIRESYYYSSSSHPKTDRDLERQDIRPTREEIGDGLVLGNCSTL